MRLIGGRFKGRRLLAPGGRRTRPTSDRLRETIFNILAHGDYPPLAGAHVADIFAGSGAMGLEALSRGATRAVFVETSRPALAALARNIADLGLQPRTGIVRVDAARLPRAEAPVDIVFLDPPYGKGLAEQSLAALMAGDWLAPGGVAVVESGREDVVTPPGGLALAECRDVGGSRLWIFSCASMPATRSSQG